MVYSRDTDYEHFVKCGTDMRVMATVQIPMTLNLWTIVLYVIPQKLMPYCSSLVFGIAINVRIDSYAGQG